MHSENDIEITRPSLKTLNKKTPWFIKFLFALNYIGGSGIIVLMFPQNQEYLVYFNVASGLFQILVHSMISEDEDFLTGWNDIEKDMPDQESSSIPKKQIASWKSDYSESNLSPKELLGNSISQKTENHLPELKPQDFATPLKMPSERKTKKSLAKQQSPKGDTK